MWNPYQPIPEPYPDAAFRTHISRPTSKIKLYLPDYLRAMCYLYNWTMREHVEMVSIAELHEYLFGLHDEPPSKNVLGHIVIQATPYNPRKLKGATKELGNKAMMCYIWRDKRDLQRGLEWMLSMWLWKILPPDEQNREGVQLSLQDLGACEDLTDIEEIWIDPMLEREEMSPDWAMLWDTYEWEIEDERKGAGIVSDGTRAAAPKDYAS